MEDEKKMSIYSKHLDKRMELIEKMDKVRSYKPTTKELEDAYGYLDYCLDCGKELRFMEAYTHGFEGNSHKFGCSLPFRILGRIYTLLKTIIHLPLILIFVAPLELFKYLKQKVKKVRNEK